MPLRGFTNGALEHENLICHIQGVAVIEVNLQLRSTILVNQSIDTQGLLVSKVIHVLNEVFKLSDRIDTKRHSRNFAST